MAVSGQLDLLCGNWLLLRGRELVFQEYQAESAWPFRHLEVMQHHFHWVTRVDPDSTSGDIDLNCCWRTVKEFWGHDVKGVSLVMRVLNSTSYVQLLNKQRTTQIFVSLQRLILDCPGVSLKKRMEVFLSFSLVYHL